jgi:BTB/POZ domain
MSLRPPRLPQDLVVFNVRGRIFQTTLTTLRRFPESILCKMVEYEPRTRATDSDDSPDPSTQQSFFIDRDPDQFAAILRYHDTEEYFHAATDSSPFMSRKSLLREAQYYNIEPLEQDLLNDEFKSTKYQYSVMVPGPSPSAYGVSSNRWDNCSHYSFPITEATANAYRSKGLDALNKADQRLLQRIEMVVKSRNEANDGFTWIVLAAFKAKEDDNMGVVLKGEKIPE